MSFQIETAWVQSYHDSIQRKFQQNTTRLRASCDNTTQQSEHDYHDRIGSTDAVPIVSRHADTPLISTPHDRRRCTLVGYHWSDLIDKNDRVRMIADPGSVYVQNGVAAMNRAIDDLIIAAFTATVYTGKTGTGTVTFPAASEVAVDKVETGTAVSSNMTIGKLRHARYLLQSQEAGGMGEGTLYCVMGPSQLQALLRTTEVTSSDYNTVKALVNGEVNQFLGFNFIISNRLTVASSIRDCFCWEKSGMLLSTASEIETQVTLRADKCYSTQVYVRGWFGAVRMWEEKVIRVKCDENK